MSDLLLDISKNPQARKIVAALGLPIPIPQDLTRYRGPHPERALDGYDVALRSTARSSVGKAIADAVARAGGTAQIVGSDATVRNLSSAGEAYARPVRALDVDELEDERFHVAIFDASDISTPDQLSALHAFFSPLMRRFRKCGRAIVVGRPASEAKDAAEAAAREALDGFVRSLAKELGKKGTTSALITVDKGAEDRLEPTLRFFASPASAYITGQSLHVSNRVNANGPYPATQSLHGKTALVTGAARGIGKATAEILAAEGAHVVVLDRPDDAGPGSKVARAIGGSFIGCDITDDDAPNIIGTHLREHRGGVDVVVHNAGITRDKTLAKMKPDWWSLTVDVNLGAVERINRHLLSDGTIRDGARLVCLSSIAGLAGNMGQTNYACAKSGVIGYVRHLAGEVAGRGIAVNAIAPGFIETRMTDAMPVALREVARRMNSLGQGGRPVDVGQAIAFLSTPGAAGLSGQVLRVCGQALIGK